MLLALPRGLELQFLTQKNSNLVEYWDIPVLYFIACILVSLTILLTIGLIKNRPLKSFKEKGLFLGMFLGMFWGICGLFLGLFLGMFLGI